jgi:hypothetical protein
MHARALTVAADLGGQTHSVVELRAVELTCRLSRGEWPSMAEVEWLVATARAIASADIATIAFAPAAAAFAIESPRRASDLFRELEQIAGVFENTYYGRQLPARHEQRSRSGTETSRSASRPALPPAIRSRSTRRARRERSLPRAAASSRRQQCSTGKRPSGGSSSGTCQSVPMRSSGRPVSDCSR